MGTSIAEVAQYFVAEYGKKHKIDMYARETVTDLHIHEREDKRIPVSSFLVFIVYSKFIYHNINNFYY